MKLNFRAWRGSRFDWLQISNCQPDKYELGEVSPYNLVSNELFFNLQHFKSFTK